MGAKGSSHMEDVRPPIEPVSRIVKSQPDGHMTWIYHTQSLPGYSHHERIEMYFEFEDGIQTENHPNPGQPYRGYKTTAFLPRTRDGEKVVQMIKKAFDQDLMFTIHTNSAGEDVVTPCDIPLKIRDDTSGPSSMCYPDSDYLKTVKEILHSKGIE